MRSAVDSLAGREGRDQPLVVMLWQLRLTRATGENPVYNASIATQKGWGVYPHTLQETCRRLQVKPSVGW